MPTPANSHRDLFEACATDPGKRASPSGRGGIERRGSGSEHDVHGIAGSPVVKRTLDLPVATWVAGCWQCGPPPVWTTRLALCS